jgi:UDPglucose 6-dehydrogenase
VLERNEQQLREILAKIKQLAGYLLYKKIIAVFGLAFKAGTNDVRNSLSLRLIEHLEREGALVRAYDPIAIPEARELLPQVECLEDPYEAVRHADALVIATDWPQFRELDFRRIKDLMAKPCIVDGRNVLPGKPLRQLGFSYVGVGQRLE